MLSPMLRAIEQLDDPVFVGVLLRSLVWSVLVFAALLAGSVWGVQAVVHQPGWLGWLAGLAGGLAAAVLAVWLFVPAAVLIAALYIDRVAAAVDRRFYPALAVPRGASLAGQTWDGAVLALQILLLQALALAFVLLLPGVGFVLWWAVAAWAIGRGLFVAVAMRRMTRTEALRLYGRRRLSVLVQGGLLALVATVPLVNLLVPVLGVAALTHILNRDASTV